MPTYEYRCESCGHELELFQNISEAPKKKCPACKKSRLKRKIGGGAGFLFKGSGFYLTDYRSESYKKAAEADSKSSASASTSGDGASDAKKDATKESAKDGAKDGKSSSDSASKPAPPPREKKSKK